MQTMLPGEAWEKDYQYEDVASNTTEAMGNAAFSYSQGGFLEIVMVCTMFILKSPEDGELFGELSTTTK